MIVPRIGEGDWEILKRKRKGEKQKCSNKEGTANWGNLTPLGFRILEKREKEEICPRGSPMFHKYG